MTSICKKLNRNKKGFTLAELLIVVAIIGVLLAILIPTFTASLQKAQVTADAANARANYSEAVVAYMDNGTPITEDMITGKNGADSDIKHSSVSYKAGIITVEHENAKGSKDLIKTFKVDPKAMDWN